MNNMNLPYSSVITVRYSHSSVLRYEGRQRTEDTRGGFACGCVVGVVTLSNPYIVLLGALVHSIESSESDSVG